jgi:hypothetical protein
MTGEVQTACADDLTPGGRNLATPGGCTGPGPGFANRLAGSASRQAGEQTLPVRPPEPAVCPGPDATGRRYSLYFLSG